MSMVASIWWPAVKPTSGDGARGRLGTPEEIAKAVVFLAPDDSKGITGQELSVGAGSSEL